MNRKDLVLETAWLRSVLQALRTTGGYTSAAGLEALRDELAALALHDAAPRASAFQDIDDEDRFRRHPLATVEALACSALLMYWPAGHATLPHDHGGLWGIEIVIDGTLTVTEFVRGGHPAAPVLSPSRTLFLGVGDAAIFDGDRYVHRCRNLSNVTPTLTLHVYGGALDAYNAYEGDTRRGFTPTVVTPRVDQLLS